MDNYHRYFDVAELIAKHIKKELTAREETELAYWLEQSAHNRELFKKLIDGALIGRQKELFSSAEKQKAWERIAKQTGLKKTRISPGNKRPLFSYAAAILLLLTIGLAVNRYFDKNSKVRLWALHQTDILPGSNKAILTLADRSKIILTDARYGKMATEQNTGIYKTQAGVLIYKNVATDLTNNTIALNTLTTPRGGQYEVVLEDGTKVWLNAASSLKYPATFLTSERHVELTGEAYFEVAKNAAKPFFVKTNGQTVEVLGTHFNINSYADEKTAKTTLLEGRVKITGNNSGTMLMLKPGQAAITNSQEIKLIPDADVKGAVAWKNGKFLFNNTDLPAVMRMVSRWYDVDVEYQGPVPERHYQGRISRNTPVSQVLEILKTSGINFIINGRKIIVRS